MAFTYEILQHKKDGHEFINITGYEGKTHELIVPETIDGYRVEAIGNHAFSGRDDLVAVSLPESVKTLYGFAFHNCKNLRKITLFDSLDDYYDGVCRQCDSLEEIDITINNSWYEVIRNFLADSDRTLKFMIHFKNIPDEGNEYLTSCLTFPEYVYDFNENTMARTIQFSIAGSGMFYRECVDRRKIEYRQYDSLFEKAKIDGGAIAQEIAIGRILFPVELDQRFLEGYETYILQNDKEILTRLVEENDSDALKNLLKYMPISDDRGTLFSASSIDAAISLSTRLGATALTAVIMDSSRKKAMPAGGMTFEF